MESNEFEEGEEELPDIITPEKPKKAKLVKSDLKENAIVETGPRSPIPCSSTRTETKVGRIDFMDVSDEDDEIVVAPPNPSAEVKNGDNADDENEKPAMDSALLDREHPLLIPAVLDIIFSYIEASTSYGLINPVQACQSVCKLWREIFFKRQDAVKLLKINDTKSGVLKTIPTHKRYFSLETLNDAFVKKFCKTVGPQMKQLHLAFPDEKIDDGNYRFPYYISKYCRNLEHLVMDLTYCAGFSGKNPWKKVEIGIKSLEGFYDPNRSPTEPIKIRLPRCPTLTKVKVYGNTQEFICFMTAVLKYARKAGEISSIEFHSTDASDLGLSFSSFFREHKWGALRKLQLQFVNKIKVDVVHEVFERLRESLESATVIFDRCSTYSLPFEETPKLLFPLTMKKLLHVRSNDQSTQVLLNSLCLPQLLTCSCVHAFLSRNDLMKSEVKRIPFKELQITSLEIKENSIELPLFVDYVPPLRNLTVLYLENATHTMLERIFTTQLKLIRLTICNIYSTKVPERNKNVDILAPVSLEWDELLTGLLKPPPVKPSLIPGKACKDLMPALERTGPSLTNLKDLTFLHLGFEYSSKTVSDFSVYHALRYMRNLQYLRLNQVKISRAARSHLKKQLLPFCRLILYKKGDYSYDDVG